MNNVALLCPTHISAMASGGNLSSENVLEVKPNLRELCEHVRVSTKWFTFGVILNLKVADLNDIKLSNGSNDEKAIMMFEMWLNTYPNATRRDIIDALKKDTIGEITVANNYETYLNELAHSTTGECVYIYIFIYTIPNKGTTLNEGTNSIEGPTPNEVTTTNEGTTSNDSTALNDGPTPYEGKVANV